MRFSISTIIGIALGVSTFMFYVSNVRPVGWFDSLVGMILGVVVFIVVKNFKGLKWIKFRKSLWLSNFLTIWLMNSRQCKEFFLSHKFKNFAQLEKELASIEDNIKKGDLFEYFNYAFFNIFKDRYNIKEVWDINSCPIRIFITSRDGHK